MQEQTQDELREAEPRPALLLPQEHHPQDGRQTLRLPLRLRRAGHAGKDGPGGADQYERSAHQHGVVAVSGRGDVGPQQRNVGIAVGERSQGTKLSDLRRPRGGGVVHRDPLSRQPDNFEMLHVWRRIITHDPRVC